MKHDAFEGQPEEREDLERMRERLERDLAHPEIARLFTEDLIETFRQFGFQREGATEWAGRILQNMRGAGSLEQRENVMRDHLYYSQDIEDRSPLASLSSQLAFSMTPFSSVTPHLLPLKGRPGTVIDYGCGDGQMCIYLRRVLGLAVEGCDIRERRVIRNKKLGIPFRKIEHNRLPGVTDKAYTAALLINVAHHEEQNEALLAELTRITSERLIVIETVPDPDPAVDPAVQRERTFLNDYVYSRLFQTNDIPVPGTYETMEEWPKRFASHGWAVAHQEYLGIDQPVFRDHHVLYVFEKQSEAVGDLRQGVVEQARGMLRDGKGKQSLSA